MYSNFVSSIDGVATLGEGTSAGSMISGKYPADRFLMALLRACADAVLLGAGTLRATPGHLWTPAHVFPQQADSFAGLRRSLGRGPEPKLVVITARGMVDASHVAIQHGALIFTTRRGADACRPEVPASCEVVATGEGDEVDLAAVIDELRNRNLGVLLTEGGPHLMGELIEPRPAGARPSSRSRRWWPAGPTRGALAWSKASSCCRNGGSGRDC